MKSLNRVTLWMIHRTMPDKYSEYFKTLGSQSTSKRSTLVTLYFTGNPIRLKMFNSASVTLTELISDTGIASGNFDDMQMAVIRYRFPLDVIGRGHMHQYLA
ncbi:hypothetical protein TNCV_4419771 [Trichonephila clavipes]|nr:hypothetical protein TNCV_4419771 [Trichonephila clavipes]